MRGVGVEGGGLGSTSIVLVSVSSFYMREPPGQLVQSRPNMSQTCTNMELEWSNGTKITGKQF